MRQQAKSECVDSTETKMAKYIAIVMLEKNFRRISQSVLRKLCINA